MHLVEHEALMPGTPHAYEIRWEPCACGRPQDHHAALREAAAPPEESDVVMMPEELLAIAA